jgi:hypothetical protein
MAWTQQECNKLYRYNITVMLQKITIVPINIELEGKSNCNKQVVIYIMQKDKVQNTSCFIYIHGPLTRMRYISWRCIGMKAQLCLSAWYWPSHPIVYLVVINSVLFELFNVVNELNLICLLTNKVMDGLNATRVQQTALVQHYRYVAENYDCFH